MKDILIGMLTTYFDMVKDGIKLDLVGEILDKGTLSTSSNIVGDLYNLISGLAIGLTIIYFCYEANSKWAFEGNDISPKSLAGPFLKLIMAVIIIENCQDWLDIAWSSFKAQFGTFYSSSDAVAIASIADSKVAATNIIQSLGIIRQVGFLIPLLILWGASTIVTLLFTYKAILFKIEFAYRIGVSPLAMADAYNGMSSSSVRWFKGMIGFMLYGCAFVAVPKLAASIIDSARIFTYYDAAGSAVTGTLKQAVEQTVSQFDDKVTAKNYLKNAGLIDMVISFMPALLIPIASLGVLGAIQQVCREAAS